MSQLETLGKLVRSVARQAGERRLRIAVVGDMILDNTIEGVSGGVHPEVNVPLLRDAHSQESIGGTANIALHLSRLGAAVSLFGLIGGDLRGRQLLNLLDRQPIDCFLLAQRGWPTPVKDWIYRRDGNHLTLIQRIDYDRPLESAPREQLVGEFRARCSQNVDVVILVDHGLGSIGPESLALVGLAKERKARIVAIPRTLALRGQPVDALVINQADMRRLGNASESADARPLAARYAREFNQHVFLTLFEQGLMVCPAGLREEQGTLIPGHPLEQPDWMGVRDIGAAIVALGLGLGMDLFDLGRLASGFRHLIASQRGNGRVVWRDLYRFAGLEVGADEPAIVRGTGV
jgi:D-beta-D-heptose 7-phosphate kinase/D-beta-D-heptose 1-phosphate adenosyltransferase